MTAPSYVTGATGRTSVYRERLANGAVLVVENSGRQFTVLPGEWPADIEVHSDYYSEQLPNGYVRAFNGDGHGYLVRGKVFSSSAEYAVMANEDDEIVEAMARAIADQNFWADYRNCYDWDDTKVMDAARAALRAYRERMVVL